MLYFDHSTSASDDDKIVALRIEHGGAAVDAYWAVIELMHRDESDFTCPASMLETDSVPTGYPAGTERVPTRYRVAFASLAHRLLVDETTLARYIATMIDVGLLQVMECADGLPDGIVSLRSSRAHDNIADYQKRAETARRNGRRNSRKTKSIPTGNRLGTDSVPTGYPAGTVSKSKSKSKIKERDKRESAPEPPESSLKSVTEQPNDYATPTLDEVRAYFGANCLRGDPDLFWATYDAKGWVDGNGIPIVRWESQALRWSKRQVSMDSERAARGEPTEAEAKWRPAAEEDPQAAYERAQAEYEEALAKLTPEERRRFNLG